MKQRIVTETTKRVTLSLTDEELRTMLKKEGIEVPRDAEIVYLVPGGGDWSNQEADIDSDNPIVIRWSETCVERN